MAPSRKKGLSLGNIIIAVIIIAAIIYFYPSLTGSTEVADIQPTAAVMEEEATPAPLAATEEPTAVSFDSSGMLLEPALPAWLKVEFTDPTIPDQVDNGIDKTVVEAVNLASTSVDITSFDLNLPSFITALKEAAGRGVQVRVVYDGENGSMDLDAARNGGKALDTIAELEKAGIGLVDGGRSSGLMHDKIIIIDGKTLFMGSWNMSYNDTFRNNNNRLEITDPQLIANYQAKFDELYLEKKFGRKSDVGALVPEMTIDGVAVENYFSPPDEVMQKLVAYVNGAQTSIRFIAFTYTHKDLAAAMISRYQSGVDVAGVIENRGASQGALVPLACASVPVKVDGNKYTMHHKVIIIDDNTVITGSFNFTNSADNENDDNIIVIHDPSVAQLYLQEYERVASIAKDPDRSKFTCP